MDVKQAKEELKYLLIEYQGKEQGILDGVAKEQREELGHPIKNVHLLSKFKANGVQYTVRESLTLERFEVFEGVQIEVGYGVDFRQLFQSLNSGYEYINEGKLADAGVTIYNIMHGVKANLQDRENPILKLCSLYITVEGEDLTKYDKVLNAAKIENWKKEGIAMESFFSLAFNLVNNFMPIYDKLTQSISDRQKEVSDKLPAKQLWRKSN